MRSVRFVLVIASLALLSTNASESNALTINNGLAPPNPANIIDFDFGSTGEPINIEDSPSGDPTTVHIVDGADTSGSPFTLCQRSDGIPCASSVVQLGGLLAGCSVSDNGFLTIDGGTTGFVGLTGFAHLVVESGQVALTTPTSRIRLGENEVANQFVTINGGQVGDIEIVAAGAGSIVVNGGEVGDIGGGVHHTINDGVVGSLFVGNLDNSLILGGSIQSIYGGSPGLRIQGGSIGELDVNRDAHVSGGSVALVNVRGSSEVVITGGDVSQVIMDPFGPSRLIIFGTGFMLDGGPVPFGKLTGSLLGAQLTGTFESGEPIDLLLDRPLFGFGAEPVIVLLDARLPVLYSPVSVVSTSELQGAGVAGRDENLIDGTGLSGVGDVETQTHGAFNFSYGMWSSGTLDGGLGGPMGFPPPVDTQEVVFDLGGEVHLTGAYVWNYNQVGETSRGVDEFEIWTATFSSFGPFTPAGVFNLSEAGGAAEPSQLIEFLTPAQGARFIKFRINTTHSGQASDFVGLSEVRFVPEPSRATGLVSAGLLLVFIASRRSRLARDSMDTA